MHDVRCSTFDVRCTIIITLLLLLQYKGYLTFMHPNRLTDRLQPRNPLSSGDLRSPYFGVKVMFVCLFVSLYICAYLSVYLSNYPSWSRPLSSLYPLPTFLFSPPFFSTQAESDPRSNPRFDLLVRVFTHSLTLIHVSLTDALTHFSYLRTCSQTHNSKFTHPRTHSKEIGNDKYTNVLHIYILYFVLVYLVTCNLCPMSVVLLWWTKKRRGEETRNEKRETENGK